MKFLKALLSLKFLPQLASTGAVILIGLACFKFPFGAGLERLSFDLPYALRSNLAAPEVVLVYLDEESARALNQPVSEAWDRSLHTKLLNRLTRDGASLIY